MKFEMAPDNLQKGLTARYVSEGGLVEVGIYRVLYGWRVRAGFVADQIGCELDWCCGDNDQFHKWAYCSLLTILERRPEDEHCFDGIPRSSAIKPAFKSPEFLAAVGLLLRQKPPSAKRQRMFRTWLVRCPHCGLDNSQRRSGRLEIHRIAGKANQAICPGVGQRPIKRPIYVGEGVAHNDQLSSVQAKGKRHG